MRKLQNTLNWAIIVTETSHIFCCVLPTLFSAISLLVGFGLVTAMPLWLEDLHAAMHDWEMPIILLSGLIVALGWALHHYSTKIDCHDTGCAHGPCEPSKKKTNTILKIATILFFVNVTVYMVFHQGMEMFIPAEQEAIQGHEGHNHDHHGHAH